MSALPRSMANCLGVTFAPRSWTAFDDARATVRVSVEAVSEANFASSSGPATAAARVRPSGNPRAPRARRPSRRDERTPRRASARGTARRGRASGSTRAVHHRLHRRATPMTLGAVLLDCRPHRRARPPRKWRTANALSRALGCRIKALRVKAGILSWLNSNQSKSPSGPERFFA